MKWINKYKPKSRQELMIPDNAIVRRIVDRLFQGECSGAGVLLYDSLADGGTGKSTFVNFLVESLGYSTVKLDTTGNTLRELEDLRKELKFRYSAGGIFDAVPEKMLVVGHEISKSPVNYIDGLREIMDDYNEHVLFIFTDNDFPKLSKNNPQVFSNQRITPLNWDLISKDDIRNYCTNILIAEGKNTSHNRDVLEKLITARRCSIRAVITGLQDNHV